MFKTPFAVAVAIQRGAGSRCARSEPFVLKQENETQGCFGVPDARKDGPPQPSRTRSVKCLSPPHRKGLDGRELSRGCSLRRRPRVRARKAIRRPAARPRLARVGAPGARPRLRTLRADLRAGPVLTRDARRRPDPRVALAQRLGRDDRAPPARGRAPDRGAPGGGDSAAASAPHARRGPAAQNLREGGRGRGACAASGWAEVDAAPRDALPVCCWRKEKGKREEQPPSPAPPRRS